MKIRLALLTTVLSLSLGASALAGSPFVTSLLGRTTNACAVQNNTTDITGVYQGVFFSGDGWAYFSIGTTQMRMKTANFPDPVPTPGSKRKATGCTPDPTHDGGFICTGLS